MASIHRATLLSFDVTTWTAMVLIEGADNEAQVPVSQWLPPALLVSNVEAAVVLFDPTNTDDGLLIAVYGSVGNWTLPGLNIGSTTGAPDGEVKTSGPLHSIASGTNVAGVLVEHAGVLSVALFDNLAGGGYSAMVQAGDAALVAIAAAANGASLDLTTWNTNGVGIRISGTGTAVSGPLDNSSAYKLNGTQIAAARRTGWAAATNTKLRTTFDTTTVTLPLLAARVAALIDDLIAHGLIGA